MIFLSKRSFLLSAVSWAELTAVWAELTAAAAWSTAAWNVTWSRVKRVWPCFTYCPSSTRTLVTKPETSGRTSTSTLPLIVAAKVLERSEVPGCTVSTASSGVWSPPIIEAASPLPEQEERTARVAERPVKETTRHNVLVIFLIFKSMMFCILSNYTYFFGCKITNFPPLGI